MIEELVTTPPIETIVRERVYEHRTSTTILNFDTTESEPGEVNFNIDTQHAQSVSLDASVAAAWGFEMEVTAEARAATIASVPTRAQISSSVSVALERGTQSRVQETVDFHVRRHYSLPPCHTRDYVNTYTRHSTSSKIMVGDLKRCLMRRPVVENGVTTFVTVITYSFDGDVLVDSSGDGTSKQICDAGPYYDFGCRGQPGDGMGGTGGELP